LLSQNEGIKRRYEMKQRMSKDLTMRRYDELRKSGMTKEEATMRIGQLLLNFYEIDWIKPKELSLYWIEREQRIKAKEI